MRRRNTALNAIQSLYDENVELKQKIALLTSKSVESIEQSENKFALLCYQEGLKEVMRNINYYFTDKVTKNNDGTYSSYEQWIEKVLSYHSNPFGSELIRDMSINELLNGLEPELRKLHKKEVENKRLNDLKKD